jgi:hypothetical protein
MASSTSDLIQAWTSLVTAAATVVAAAAAVAAAIWARNIGKRQNEINAKMESLQTRQTEADHFVEISVQAVPLNMTQASLMAAVAPATWGLVVRSIGTYPVYLESYTFSFAEGTINALGAAVVPSNGYTIEVNQVDIINLPNRTFVLNIYFEDHAGKRYKSLHAGMLMNAGTKLIVQSNKKVEAPE